MNNNAFDTELNNIELIKLHPTYLPFVGEAYDEYRVLHIGESHYIDQTPDNETYNIKVFADRWWKDPCNDIFNASFGWVDTRAVMDRYMKGEKGSYSIFTNFIKSFSKVVLDNPIPNISLDDKSLYKYIAFMNFFQMPSLYEGMKFWDSLELSANIIGEQELASMVWNEAVKKSVDVVDAVIEILNPRAIVFTSISAGNAYKDFHGKFSKDERIIYTSHPGYPFTWWKDLRSLGGKKGIEVFESQLERIFKEKSSDFVNHTMLTEEDNRDDYMEEMCMVKALINDALGAVQGLEDSGIDRIPELLKLMEDAWQLSRDILDAM